MRAIIDAGTVVAPLAIRILGRTTAEDVKDPASNKVVVKRGTLLTEPEVEAITNAGVQELKIRSVLTCESKNGVCGACYGRDLARGTPVNMGEAVGVIAAQSIGEPGTQLTMRTFHIGGAAQISEQSFIESNFDGKIKFKGKNIAKNSDGDVVAMVRNMVVAVVDPDGTERAHHRIPYGARMRVEDGDKIKRGQRIAEWDPYTRPILTEVEGSIAFEDLVDGLSMSEALDELTGIAKRVVIDWRTGSSRNQQDLRPAIVIKSGSKLLKLARGGDARYVLAVDAIISVDPGAHVKAGDVIARIPTESAKTRDITGGLPRVAELFEARKPKDAAIIAEIGGTVRFGKDYKNKRRLTLEPTGKGDEPKEYLIPKGKHIHLQDGDVIEKGDYIVEGNPAPHDILAIKGVEELAAYLVNEIQEVYRLQGVNINDKHIEVIVRQMLQKVEIDEAGETELLQGEQIDKTELDEINARVEADGKKPASGHPVLLGITKASLQTRSFISAASFQETTRVLTEAAVNGKADTLDGLKENVIVGRLIPAGTGAMMDELREVAVKRDALILEEREKDAAKAAAKAEAAEAPALPAARIGRFASTTIERAARKAALFLCCHTRGNESPDRAVPCTGGKSAVLYQIYPRSFQDSDGDGVGDLPGILARLPYLAELGVDALWLSPIFASPMADFGYDIADYTAIDPLFGSMADFDALLAAAHARGIKVLLDFVPNHTSDRASVVSRKPGLAQQCETRLVHLARSGAPGGGPPNNWLSEFGGSAWAFDERTGQYYYHAFLAAQPDLNWRNPRGARGDARRHAVLARRGVDGFRVDVIWHLIKDDGFRDNPPNPDFRAGEPPHRRLLPLYSADRPEVHDVDPRPARRGRRISRARADRRDLSAARAAGRLLRPRSWRRASAVQFQPAGDALARAGDRAIDRSLRGGFAGRRLAELGARQSRPAAARDAASGRSRRAWPPCCC